MVGGVRDKGVEKRWLVFEGEVVGGVGVFYVLGFSFFKCEIFWLWSWVMFKDCYFFKSFIILFGIVGNVFRIFI